MTTDESDIPELELQLDDSAMKASGPKKPNQTSTKFEYQEPKVELDWNVPHGQLAARQRGGSRPLRVSGQIQLGEKVKSGEEPKVGMPAPTFRAITFDGKQIDLLALRGKKVWLTFYRYATCPLCNLHIAEAARHYPTLKTAGMEIVAVFDSRVPEFHQPGGIHDIRFPIISDPDKKLYHLYETRSNVLGVLHPAVLVYFVKALSRGFKQGAILGGPGQLPSSFLIDQNGIVREVFHGKTAADYLPWKNIERFAGV